MHGKGEAKAPICVGEHQSRLSVSHAAFNSVGQVATASYDDTVKIHSFEGMGGWSAGHTLEESSMEPSATIRHNNQTGRWVTMYVYFILFASKYALNTVASHLTLQIS